MAQLHVRSNHAHAPVHFPSKQKASGMVYQRDWWRVAGFIMEKPEKHGLVHNGKARKTRSCSSWGILETTRGCSHSEPRPAGVLSRNIAFRHRILLFVMPFFSLYSRQSFRCDGRAGEKKAPKKSGTKFVCTFIEQKRVDEVSRPQLPPTTPKRQTQQPGL